MPMAASATWIGSEKRLLDPNPASHHFGVEANAFLKIAAGNADVVKRFELGRAVYANGLGGALGHVFLHKK